VLIFGMCQLLPLNVKRRVDGNIRNDLLRSGIFGQVIEGFDAHS
jgi:hypothetical protein